eukprot:777013-Prymnesium_polylepis.1
MRAARCGISVAEWDHNLVMYAPARRGRAARAGGVTFRRRRRFFSPIRSIRPISERPDVAFCSHL